MTDYIKKQYNCKICNETHKIELPKNLCDGRTKYPFPYVFLHGSPKDILTILYIDKGLKIRGAEVQELQEDNLFSKEQVVAIVQPLIEEIENLRNENLDLRKNLQESKS